MLGLALWALMAAMPEPCAFGAVCSSAFNGRPATATITLNVMLTSGSSLVLNETALEPGVMRVAVRALTTGVPESASDSATYIVLMDTAEKPVTFAWYSPRLEVQVPEGALAFRIPEGDDGRRIVRAVRAAKQRQIVGWLASARVQKVVRSYSG